MPKLPSALNKTTDKIVRVTPTTKLFSPSHLRPSKHPSIKLLGLFYITSDLVSPPSSLIILYPLKTYEKFGSRLSKRLPDSGPVFSYSSVLTEASDPGRVDLPTLPCAPYSSLCPSRRTLHFLSFRPKPVSERYGHCTSTSKTSLHPQTSRSLTVTEER